MKNVTLFILMLLYLSSFTFCEITDLRIAYFCPNDNKDSDGVPQIPDEFLKRAKKNGYTHILVDYFLSNGGDIGGRNDWVNGRYNLDKAINRYSSGGLYGLLYRDIKKIKDFGLGFIPCFGVGGTGAHWEYVNNTHMDIYEKAQHNDNAKKPIRDVACIAPGRAQDSYTGQPDGFIATFEDFCKVLQAACDANDYTLEYLDLGYSECWEAGTRNEIWGTTKIGGSQSIDQKWIAAAPAGTKRTVNDLVIASLEEKIDIIHNSVGGKLSSAKICLLGDMFSTVFQKAYNFSLSTNSFLDKAMYNSLLKSNLIFILWQYQRFDRNGKEYNTEDEFKQFTDKQFDVIYCRIICDGDNTKTAETTTENIPELVRAVKTAKKVGKHVIGYMSAHWDNHDTSKKPGYTNNNLCWNGMEYLAYGNQIVRSPVKFVRISGGRFNGDTITDLLCGETEVTQADYYALTGRFPFNNYMSGNLNMPAENITWYDALLYCNASSIREGLKPVYSFDAPKDNDFKGENCSILRKLNIDTSANGYRLPTENEWKYIYLAGVSPVANKGNFWPADSSINDYCWYKNNSGTLKVVGTRRANRWGLYDMAGNVSEYTSSHDTKFISGIAGSSYSDDSNDCHYNYIVGKSRKDKNTIQIGFRVVRRITRR